MGLCSDIDTVNYQYFAASGSLGSSDLPMAVYGLSFLSGGTAGVVTLKSAGTAIEGEAGTVNQFKTITFMDGHVFPNGCYVSFDSNVSKASVFYRQVKTT